MDGGGRWRDGEEVEEWLEDDEIEKRKKSRDYNDCSLPSKNFKNNWEIVD